MNWGVYFGAKEVEVGLEVAGRAAAQGSRVALWEMRRAGEKFECKAKAARRPARPFVRPLGSWATSQDLRGAVCSSVGNGAPRKIVIEEIPSPSTRGALKVANLGRWRLPVLTCGTSAQIPVPDS